MHRFGQGNLAIVLVQLTDEFDPNMDAVDSDLNPEGTGSMSGFPPNRPWGSMKPCRLMACLGLSMLSIIAWGQAKGGIASATPAKAAAATTTTATTVSRVATPATLLAVPDESSKEPLPQASASGGTLAPATEAVFKQNAQANAQYADVQSFAEARERMRRAFMSQDYQSVLTLSRQVEQKYEVDQSGDFYVAAAKMRLDEQKAHQKGQSAYPYPSISDFAPKQIVTGSMPSVDPDFSPSDATTPPSTPLAGTARQGGATASSPASSTKANPMATQARLGKGPALPGQPSKPSSAQANAPGTLGRGGASANAKQVAMVATQRPGQASAVATGQAIAPLASINPTEQIYVGLVVVALLILGLIFLFVLRRREQPEEDLAKTLSELAGEPVTVAEGPASALGGSTEKAESNKPDAGAPAVRSGAPAQEAPFGGVDLDTPITTQPSDTTEAIDVSDLFEDGSAQAASIAHAETRQAPSEPTRSTTLDDILWEEMVADEKQDAQGEGLARQKNASLSHFEGSPVASAPSQQSDPPKSSDELYEELFGQQPLPASTPKPDAPASSIDLESLPLADHRVDPNLSANSAIVLEGLEDDSAPKSEEASDASPKTDQKTKESTEFSDLPEITREQQGQNLNDTLTNVDDATLPSVSEATASGDADDMTLPSIADQPTQPSRESIVDGEASETIESSEFVPEPGADAVSEDLFDREKREGETCLQHQDWNGAVHHLSVASALRPDQAGIKEMLREARRMRRVHGDS
jgi:hypothetical protein